MARTKSDQKNGADFFDALDEFERVKGIKKEVCIEALEAALAVAYKKFTGEARVIKVLTAPDSQLFRTVSVRHVVEEPEDRESEISLEDARTIDKKYKVGDVITEEISSKEFTRIAAQTAKQIIMQKIREAENENAVSELSQKVDDLITCVVRRVEGKNVYVEINKFEAVLYPTDQLPTDKFVVGDKIKVYVKGIKSGLKGPQVLVSRSVPGFIRRLFEIEVPEIAAGVVQIKGIVREAGLRTKLAVYSTDPKVDAVGSCVGNRGSRVNSIISEISGEKIDIIPWHEDILEYIARALMPAKVVMVEVNDNERSAKVVVMDDQLSLAIGRDGVNARLAAKLTGFKIDIKPYSIMQTEVKEAEEQAERMGSENPDVFDEDLGDLE